VTNTTDMDNVRGRHARPDSVTKSPGGAGPVEMRKTWMISRGGEDAGSGDSSSSFSLDPSRTSLEQSCVR